VSTGCRVRGLETRVTVTVTGLIEYLSTIAMLTKFFKVAQTKQ